MAKRLVFGVSTFHVLINIMDYSGTKSRRLTPMDKAIEWINIGVDQDGLAIEYINDIKADVEVTKPKEQIKSKPKLQKPKKSLPVKRKPWKKEESALLKRYFHKNIIEKKPPCKNDILLQGRKNKAMQSLLQSKGWISVKHYVWNLAQQHHKQTKNILS